MRRSLLPALFLSCVLAPPALAQDLAAAIGDALAYAPAMAEASAAEAAASARVDRARAERNPLLKIEGSAGFGRMDNGGFFGITAGNTTPLTLQAMAEYPLFTGGRIPAAIDQARGGSEIAKLQTEQLRLVTIVDAVTAYADVLTSRRLVDRYRHLMSELTETERQAQLLFRSGASASTELAQTRARKAEGEAGSVQAEGRLASAEARFDRLTGKPATELAALPQPPAIPPSLEIALDSARSSNPSLLQAARSIAVARAGVRAARAEGLPMIGAFAEADHIRDQSFPGYRADSVAVGLRGRWTLWAGGRVSAQVRVAEADLSVSEARARQANQNVEGLVIDAWQAYQTATRMVDATALRSLAANEALRGTKLESQVGAKPTLAVLDAEREALEAEAADIEAQGVRLVTAYRLNALTGNIP
jgi:outer membrane protein